MSRALVLFACLALGTACIGTTGSELVTFEAFAAGPADATRDLTFTKGEWAITLTTARLRVGAVYLNRSVPVSGGQERECFLPGVYVAQVLSGITVDALSPALQRFPGSGSGTADHAASGEVWLTGGPIDADPDPTTIAVVEGSATRGAETIRFEGNVTINNNRRELQTDPARPGREPLCSKRIVTPIPTSVTPTNGGKLVVRIDPRPWFDNINLDELASLPTVTLESNLRRIPDDQSSQPAKNLYKGLQSASPVAYRFEWHP
jgi:hypothetical protein